MWRDRYLAAGADMRVLRQWSFISKGDGGTIDVNRPPDEARKASAGASPRWREPSLADAAGREEEMFQVDALRCLRL